MQKRWEENWKKILEVRRRRRRGRDSDIWNGGLGEGARERILSQWKIRASQVNYSSPSFRPSLVHAQSCTFRPHLHPAPHLYFRFHIRANTPTPFPTQTKLSLISFLTDIDSWDARKWFPARKFSPRPMAGQVVFSGPVRDYVPIQFRGCARVVRVCSLRWVQLGGGRLPICLGMH